MGFIGDDAQEFTCHRLLRRKHFPPLQSREVVRERQARERQLCCCSKALRTLARTASSSSCLSRSHSSWSGDARGDLLHDVSASLANGIGRTKITVVASARHSCQAVYSLREREEGVLAAPLGGAGWWQGKALALIRCRPYQKPSTVVYDTS